METDNSIRVWELAPNNFKSSVEVAACYLEINGEILLLERSPNSPEGNTWCVPAGKIESGELPIHAMIRELFEETGIKVTPSEVKNIGKLYIQKATSSYVYHLFQVVLSKKPIVILSTEHSRYTWTNILDIENMDLIGGGQEALIYYTKMKDKT